MGISYGTVATGTWQTIRNNRRRRLASWVDEETGKSIFFEFRRNGRIKMYSDQDGDGKFNRRNDVLIGKAKYTDWDRDDYSRNHFKRMRKGTFEIEVEGWTNADGTYEGAYNISLDSGLDYESRSGSSYDITKWVEVPDHNLLTSIFQPDA